MAAQEGELTPSVLFGVDGACGGEGLKVCVGCGCWVAEKGVSACRVYSSWLQCNTVVCLECCFHVHYMCHAKLIVMCTFFSHATYMMQAVQQEFFETLWRDTVAFGGIFIIRRLVGIAHVMEMDSIEVCG